MALIVNPNDPMMTHQATLIERDLKHIWHPCSHLPDFEQAPPLIVERAHGSYLYTDQGPLIDGISSWWCKSLGHGHPAVMKAIHDQLNRFEHVISANTTHPAVVELAEHLEAISGKQHVYFACDGSSAVEIALKLALHAQQLQGKPERHCFMALQHGYHGETFGTLSVSDLGQYKDRFNVCALDCHFIQDIPYVSDQQDPLWSCSESAWNKILPSLNALQAQTCALVLEPIVQGAGGMRCYSADFLKRLAQWAKQHDIYLIADEIMTGLGRTGTWLASDHAGIQADMVCLSKGLTSGTMPLSCVLIDHKLYELFYQPFDAGKSFLHSHTYGGHPVAVCAALATIKTLREENLIQRANTLGQYMQRCFTEIAAQTGQLKNIRSIGAWVAADLAPCTHPRPGHHIALQAQKRGALLRPMGNTLYWLPPLNTDFATLDALANITFEAIQATYHV